MKTYKTSEAFEQLEKNKNIIFKKCNALLKLKADELGNIYFEEFNEVIPTTSIKVTAQTEWELVENNVSFLQAIKALDNGLVIYSNIRGAINVYRDRHLYSLGNSVSTEQILKGKWFIGEPKGEM